MKIKQVYNLEFPSYIDELNIKGYRFKRIPEYEKAFQGLCQLSSSIGGEFSYNVKTGGHQITGTVEIPINEESSILPWAKKQTLLDDIILLLTIFTKRNVFTKEWGDNEEVAIVIDSRMHTSGSELKLATYEPMLRHKETGILVGEKAITGTERLKYDLINIGLEKNINHIIDLISSSEWKEKYDEGYALFLYKQAAQPNNLEISFILSWTIWEHIVTLHNKKWLEKTTLEKLHGSEKISYILAEYFLIKIDDTARKQIKILNKTRNRIIHYGKIPDEIDIKEMELFKKLTEQLIIMILGIKPTNHLNSMDKLQDFLKGK